MPSLSNEDLHASVNVLLRLRIRLRDDAAKTHLGNERERWGQAEQVLHGVIDNGL